jgi:putative transposase
VTVTKRSKRAKPTPEPIKLANSPLANHQKPEDPIGENGLLKQLTQMLVERAWEAEMTGHLGHGKSDEVTNDTANTRNGCSAKTLKGDFGALLLDIPRDRQGSLAPPIVGKHLFRRQDHLAVCAWLDGAGDPEPSGGDLGHRRVAEPAIDRHTRRGRGGEGWRARSLNAGYPILYLDCIHVGV